MGSCTTDAKFIYFPEQPWLTPSLVVAGILAIHLGQSLHDLIKNRFANRQEHTSIEMSRGDGHAGKWMAVFTCGADHIAGKVIMSCPLNL